MAGLRWTEREYADWCAANGVQPEPGVSAAQKSEARRVVEGVMRTKLEEKFAALWNLHGGPMDYRRNYEFDRPDSGMQFDFAWPSLRFAVEINGGQYKGARSGHGSVRGLERDAKKILAAARKGWRLVVLPTSLVTHEHVAKLVRELQEAQP